MTNAEDTKELRLALVCYGGSSLAIYMHGVTKELHRLVKGSARAELGVDAANESTGSDGVYRQLLDELTTEQGVRTRVVVDVIAGTSAGGINGVYLAKALAHNRSQDALRDLWFERGDVNQLLLGPRFVPWWLRLPFLLPLAMRRSIVRGDAMAKWLYDALQEMDGSRGEPDGLESLMPDGSMLELFVTIADFYGYDRELPIAEPKLVRDRRHRHALVFRYRDGSPDNFRPEDNGGLAFAARTTSSFPGAFPSVSFEAFRKWVPEADTDAFAKRSFRLYELAHGDPTKTQFIDGGVLDNKPFGWAIHSIFRRPADVEVDRRLLYLEPDPGEVRSAAADDSAKPAPGTIQAAIGAASGLPRKEPILDDLLEVEAHNERVALIREVIETNFDPVAAILEKTLGSLEQLPTQPSLETLGEWNAKTHAAAIEQAGPAYSSYLRLKISAAVGRYAQTVNAVCDYPFDSSHAMFVRYAIRRWTDGLGLFERSTAPTKAQLNFLRNFDLGFGERRLGFVIAALRWWYRDLREGKPDIPPRADIDEGKGVLYAARRMLRRTMGGDDYPESLQVALRECFAQAEIDDLLARTGRDPDEFIAQHAKQLVAVVDDVAAFQREALGTFNEGVFTTLSDLTATWAAARRSDLLVRYLGFPLWDVLLYPIQHLADAGEKDAVEVVRLSPFEADVLRTPAADKVHGKQRFHFGAFFDRRARENDYLWGRLDGAANLVAVVLGKDHPAYREWCFRAFEAILDEERDALTHIAPTLRALSDEVAAAQS
ncbi:MAG TPA: patatin-like protein [Gaiellaceae bacterium]|nr:patatin-like protein [Gaiellaceae bacterium]